MTYKQKLVAQKMVENGGNIGKAMIAAGYSPATAKTPQKLTNSNGWKELMEELAPDKNNLNKLRQLIDAEDVVVVKRAKGRTTTIRKMNYNAVAKGLDMVFKLKGQYAAAKPEHYEDPNEHLTDEELDAKIEFLEKQLGRKRA